MTTGSRRQVFNGNADRTSGGLTKKDLFKKNGRIKSKKASRKAKKNKNLLKAGWTCKKGQFGAIKREEKPKRKSPKRKSKKRGGASKESQEE